MTFKGAFIVRGWPFVSEPWPLRLYFDGVTRSLGPPEKEEFIFRDFVSPPIGLRRVGNVLPRFFGVPRASIVSQEIYEAWRGLANVVLLPVVIEKLIDWPDLGSLPPTWKEELTMQDDPLAELLDEMPDCPRLHAYAPTYWWMGLPSLYVHVLPRILDRIAEENRNLPPHPATTLITLTRYINADALSAYPIMLVDIGYAMSERHARAVEPFFDPRFYRVMTFEEVRALTP